MLVFTKCYANKRFYNWKCAKDIPILKLVA